jgi:hypothetical protein
MSGTLATFLDGIFPGRRFFEYYLQRLRLVVGNKTRLLKVTGIRDVPRPENPEEFPGIEVVIRISGLTLRNPVTNLPLLDERTFKEYFESWPVQKAFLDWFAQYIADSIPENGPEALLNRKFATVNEGRPGTLPPRADLLLVYQRLSRQLRATRAWLLSLPKKRQGFTEDDKRNFLSEAPRDSFWWIYLVERGDLTLSQISSNTPRSSALLILTIHYGVEEVSIRSRLFRPEK